MENEFAKTQAEIKASIQHLLDTNDRAVVRGLVRIYERQTQSEKAAHTTTESNGVGFTGVDADFLTSLAEKAIKYGSLTPNQLFYARKKVKKYWKQLAEVAHANGSPLLKVRKEEHA